MLWYKSWLETRWRFLIGIALLFLSAAGAVISYPQVMHLLPLADTVQVAGEIGRRIRENAALAHSYRGYIWSQWIREELCQMGTLFAVLLGTGGLLAQRSGVLFTLSMPVSRHRVVGVRAATGLGQLLLLLLVPPLLIPLLSPSVGQSYGIGDALAYTICAFVGASVFFSLAFLLSTVFSDVWRPMLLALALAILLAIAEQLWRGVFPYGLFRVMSGESYFRSGALPWIGLLAAAALSTAMQYAAAANVARQDF